MDEYGYGFNDSIHRYFGLSYASWLVMPRTLLQSMPRSWSEPFADMLGDFDDHWSGLPDDYLPSGYTVMPREGSSFSSWTCYRLPHYNRGRTIVDHEGKIVSPKTITTLGRGA